MVYGSPYSSPYGSARTRVPPAAPSSTGLGNLLEYLDIPGQYTRGLLAGRPGERLSGVEFNQAYGLGDSALAGLGTEILLDPLNLLQVGALAKAGRVVSKAGRLGRAGEYLTKAAQAGKAAPEIARRAEQAAGGAANLSRLSAAEIAGKPLVRPRAATRFGTVRQIAAGMDNADEAADLLKKASGLEDAPLSKDIGIGLPFMNPLLSFNVPGGVAARDLMDTAVKGLKFSPIGRGVRYALDSSVGNTFDEASQVLASGSKTLADEAVARETRKGVESAMKLRQNADPEYWIDETGPGERMVDPNGGSGSYSRVFDPVPEGLRSSGKGVFSDEANLMLGDKLEGVFHGGQSNFGQRISDGILDAEEFSDDPAIEEYIDWWRKTSEEYLKESRKAGIDTGDASGYLKYLPRMFNPIAEDAFAAASGGARKTRGVASTFSSDQLSRSDVFPRYLNRRAIVDMTTDPDLVGPGRLPPKEAAQKIYDKHLQDIFFNPGDPWVPEKSAEQLLGRDFDPPSTAELAMVAKDRAGLFNAAERLAGFLAKIDPEKIPKGLFSEHPTSSIINYMRSRTRAIENAKSITDYVVSKAVKSGAAAQGEPTITVAEALKRGGLALEGEAQAGFRQSVREKLARSLGVSADGISLSEYHVPESIGTVLKNATGGSDVVELKTFAKVMKSMGDLWRNSILAWPSRYTRDLIGGTYVNFLEGASSGFGMHGAWKVLRGRALDSPDFLRKIPEYSGITDDASLVTKFYSDLASTGLADGTLRYDLGQSQALRTTLPGIDEIAPHYGKMARSVFGRKGAIPDVLRPDSTFYRETGALNDFIDTYNRLSGYLELLRQGVDPMEAGRRMTRAHIDYTGLTDTEQFVRRYVPFYTYTSRMAQETGRKLVEQPRRLVASGRVIDALPELFGDNEGGDDYIPKSMRERVAIPFSSDSTGKTVGYNVDLPGIESINWLAGERPVRSALSNLSPQFNFITEEATGRDSFTGRPLSQTTTPIGRVVGGDNDLTRYIDRIGQLAPLYPRVSRVAADLAEDRGAAPPGGRYAQTAINAFTGYKVRRLTREDLDRQLAYELEDQVEPYTREYATSYVPEETLATMPPEAQRAWLALQQIRKSQRQARRASGQ